MAKRKKPASRPPRPADQGAPQLYTLVVFLRSGPINEKFAKKNPVISRTIQIRGDQTLEQFHHAIFEAFDRWDEHLYEFQFGKGMMDPKGLRYSLASVFANELNGSNPPAGRVDQTTIASLKLKVGRSFGYWFDFGDDWWHQVDLEAIEDNPPEGKFPHVIERVGKSPPQYPEAD